MRLSALRASGAIACAAIALTACGAKQTHPAVQPKPLVKHAPPTPIDKKKAELGGTTWNPAWDRIVEEALPPAMLSERVPRDVRRFCPSFYVMSPRNKRAFWAYFFQALAGAEAGLNPRAKVAHTEPILARQEHVAPTKVLTEGLLQLTYDDQKRYGCNFDAEADRGLAPSDPARTILQPKNNLTCGVTILNNQIMTQHKPLLSPTSYWATLRPGTLSYRVFARQMTNPPAACGLHAIHDRRDLRLAAAAQ